jgi:N-acetylmuramic acid 6-phosphate etherase
MNIPITEQLFLNSKPIDQLSIKNGINIILDEQTNSSLAVKKILKDIEVTVCAIANHLEKSKSSRLIYAGAGTSGRIGLQDGVELVPTFGWLNNRLEFIIAGGKRAVFRSIENAEDDVKKARQNFNKLKINNKDVLIGIAASGNTPFTCEILKMGFEVNALTIAISNNPDGKILDFGSHKLILNTKQEVIAGSTRLKAGTAQKICLNIISTMVMTKLGFVKNGMMVNLIPTNEKLKKRKARIEEIT